MSPSTLPSAAAHPINQPEQKGFTLVEIVVVIVLIGILAATLTIFLRPATDAYVGVSNRATLTDAADTALRRMTDDIRRAVPNSIRSISASCFQLVPSRSGGRYRMAPDTKNDAEPCTPTNCSAPLDPTQATSAFDVLEILSPLPNVTNWVVVNNQNTDDVYTGTNRTQITAIKWPSPAGAPRTTDGAYRFTVTPKQFPTGYDGGRFVVVADTEQTVFYSCRNSTLFRTVASFATTPAIGCAAANSAPVATNVTDCTFVYSPTTGMTSQNGLVWMRLELSLGGESVALAYGVHVDNVP